MTEPVGIGRVGPYILIQSEPSRPGLEAFRAQRPGAPGFAKTVCVEVIDRQLTERQSDIDRIVASATAAAELQHRTLVQLFELAEEKGSYYIAREHVVGASLARILAAAEGTPEGGRLPPWLTLHVCMEVLTALAHLHERNIEHGALDLDSVVITKTGEVKLLGTGVYAAIESPSADRPGDVFQLGLLLRRILAGVDPMDGGFSTFGPTIHPDLGDLVLRMSAPDPRERPANARVAITAMSRFLAGLGPARTSQDVAKAVAAMLRGATPKGPSRPSGTPLPVLEEQKPVQLIPRAETLWDGDTGEFYHHFVPPRPSFPTSHTSSEPLLLLSFGDGRIERAETLDQINHLWMSSPLPPRLVARPGTAWYDALRFAERAGLEHLIDDDEQLREVAHVGDLAQTSLISLLADMQRRNATGRLMILDGSRMSRRVVDLIDGAVVRVATRHPTDQLPEWLLRRGHTTLNELPSLFREVIATDTHLLDVVARRRRLELSRLWSTAWIDRLSDPLRARRGRYAFDSAARPVEKNSAPLPAASVLIDCVRCARTPEQLRQWAAHNKSVEYAPAADLVAWIERLKLDARLQSLANEITRHETLESVLKKLPGDGGAIFLVAFLLQETRGISLKA